MCKPKYVSVKKMIHSETNRFRDIRIGYNKTKKAANVVEYAILVYLKLIVHKRCIALILTIGYQYIT